MGNIHRYSELGWLPISHVAVAEMFEESVTVGYIPNDGSDKLYFTSLS